MTITVKFSKLREFMDKSNAQYSSVAIRRARVRSGEDPAVEVEVSAEMLAALTLDCTYPDLRRKYGN